jgi:hypothetical protein
VDLPRETKSHRGAISSIELSLRQVERRLWCGHNVYKRAELPAKVYRVDLATGRKEFWKEFMPADPAGVNNLAPILRTPDGKSYVYSYRRELSELYLVDGLK